MKCIIKYKIKEKETKSINYSTNYAAINVKLIGLLYSY